MEVGYNSGGNLYFSMNVTPWFSSGVSFTGVNMRKSCRNLWIYIVLCGILSAAFICIYCFAPFDFIEMNEDNTQEYEAMVNTIAKEGENYYVTLREYPFTLFLDHSCFHDREAMQVLSTGDKVYFRLFQGELDILEPYEGIAQLSVISIRTDHGSIITLDSFNAYHDLQVKNIKIALMSLFALFFIMMLVLIVLQVHRVFKRGQHNS